MLNLVPLCTAVTTNANQTAVTFGPSASAAPANRLMPGETAVLFLAPNAAYDGTVRVEVAEDGTTYADSPEFSSGGSPGAALSLATGRQAMYEIKIAEFMRIVTASRTAGALSAYIISGS